MPCPCGALTPIRHEGQPWDPAPSPVIVKSTHVPPPPTPAMYSWAVSCTCSSADTSEVKLGPGQASVWMSDPWKHSRQWMGRDAADLGQPTADDPHGYFPSKDENQVTGRDRGRAWIPGLTKWVQFSKNSNRVLNRSFPSNQCSSKMFLMSWFLKCLSAPGHIQSHCKESAWVRTVELLRGSTSCPWECSGKVPTVGGVSRGQSLQRLYADRAQSQDVLGSSSSQRPLCPKQVPVWFLVT